jgi:transketolase
VRNQFAAAFYELGKNDPRLALVVADISPAGSITKFREEFPERFINTGVSEQSMIGIAAGMAIRGMRPFAYTIATFALYRPFEFIRDDIAYQELPITVVGVGGGVSYSTLGGTHHAMEDIAIASAIPGMQVLAPCDPAETKLITEWCATTNEKPTYLRLGKAGEPDLTASAIDPFVPGKVRRICQGQDVCIISYGPTVKMALDLAQQLQEKNKYSSTVVSCHSLKPLDVVGIENLLATHKTVIIIEEHVPHGGLGSRVKEIAWDMRSQCELRCYSLQDKFLHVYGGHDSLLKAHGLDVNSIYKEIVAKKPLQQSKV